MTKPARTRPNSPQPAQDRFTARIAQIADRDARAKAEAAVKGVEPEDLSADAFMSEPFAMYHLGIARMLGSIPAATLFNRIYFWSSTPTVENREGGGFYWTQEQIEEETALGRASAIAAKNLLRERGIITTKMQGVPAKLWIYLDKREFYRQWNEFRRTRPRKH